MSINKEIHQKAIERARDRRMQRIFDKVENYFEHTYSAKTLRINVVGFTIMSFLISSALLKNHSDLFFFGLAMFNVLVIPPIFMLFVILYELSFRIYKSEKRAASTHASRKKKYFKKHKNKMQSLKK